ncbi:MAG: ribonuclease HI [Thiotrichales bacterium]|jgi:ribonuclease HI|nr:ribonuclease HI [Thiotrichales bacterium]MBT3612911.1 ribonuclease HI [Thiotrichales bacterium]MBT3752318.1 ribonuclease HI [Thiotrichales bacterium]MBT3837070.1 ribonuclease HI [Thiotrichales bacterium]MBT4152489.1 ribonuclease HI [Thiotrichales bacterium]
MSSKILEIFTDGGCRGNPGVGGWGALLRYGSVERELFGGEEESTNNRMELTAVIRALEAITRDRPLRITTDSKYVKDGITKWIHNWKKNGWRTAARKPVKNSDLWKELDLLVQRYDIEWAWIKGHSGHRENEIADELANRGMDTVNMSE